MNRSLFDEVKESSASTCRAEIWCDGACSGNPGAGGWGAIVEIDGVRRELSGGAAHTTNNQMEMQALIKALKSCSRRHESSHRHRFRLRGERRDAVDQRLDSQRLENCVQSAGEKSGIVAANSRAVANASTHFSMGQRPRRTRRKRTLRRIGAHRHRAFSLKVAVNVRKR